MAVTPSALRSDLYRMLDQVLATGEPLEIKRGDRLLKITPVNPPSKIERLMGNPSVVIGDPEELVGISWEDEWTPSI